MAKVRVNAFSISIDGFGAGPRQSLENPLGVGGRALHDWAFATRTFQRMFGQEGGATGIDDDFAARSFENVGAWILGRNMFGPLRGPWPDERWKGWWGDTPPYHVPVFVLTHHSDENRRIRHIVLCHVEFVRFGRQQSRAVVESDFHDQGIALRGSVDGLTGEQLSAHSERPAPVRDALLDLGQAHRDLPHRLEVHRFHGPVATAARHSSASVSCMRSGSGALSGAFHSRGDPAAMSWRATPR